MIIAKIIKLRILIDANYKHSYLTIFLSSSFKGLYSRAYASTAASILRYSSHPTFKPCGVHASCASNISHLTSVLYTGIIGNTCPGCGREETPDQPKFERIRRITGYLVGTLDHFNDAKRAEVEDRVKHTVKSEMEMI